MVFERGLCMARLVRAVSGDCERGLRAWRRSGAGCDARSVARETSWGFKPQDPSGCTGPWLACRGHGRLKCLRTFSNSWFCNYTEHGDRHPFGHRAATLYAVNAAVHPPFPSPTLPSTPSLLPILSSRCSPHSRRLAWWRPATPTSRMWCVSEPTALWYNLFRVGSSFLQICCHELEVRYCCSAVHAV